MLKSLLANPANLLNSFVVKEILTVKVSRIIAFFLFQALSLRFNEHDTLNLIIRRRIRGRGNNGLLNIPGDATALSGGPVPGEGVARKARQPAGSKNVVDSSAGLRGQACVV